MLPIRDAKVAIPVNGLLGR